MEDLIPFLIFIVIAVANLIKFAADKNRKSGDKPKPSPSEAPKKEPSSIEEFFEGLATAFEPKPTELPDWPEDRERPDYMHEMEEFETAQPSLHDEDRTVEITPAPAPEPTWQQAAAPAAIVDIPDQIASLKAAMKAMPAMSSGSRSLRFASSSILSNRATGGIDVDLEDRAALRKAMIAHIIFSPPRAYDTSFESTYAG